MLEQAPGAAMAPRQPLLAVHDLRKYFFLHSGILPQFLSSRARRVHAVDGISFALQEGETLGLVGESGCGKSTAGLTVLQLLEPDGGAVWFRGRNVVGLPPGERRLLRKDMQMVFQNPYSSLNPRMRVGEIVAEPLYNFRLGSGRERGERVEEVLRHVGLDPAFVSRYPHEFSGGQRQRIGIARALALRPKLIVADEPVSALDVSVQAQILNLMLRLKEEFNLTYLFISHDLSVVRYISDRIAVMYLGELVELAPADAIYDEPLHPYTQALMSAIPEPDPNFRRERILLQGGVPSPIDPPSGCRFHPRCPIAVKRCASEKPALRTLGDGRQVMCHLAG